MNEAGENIYNPYRPCKDLTGMKFGKLTVVRYSHIAKMKSHWWCICECGQGQRAMYSQLIRGVITQCRLCRNAAIGVSHRIHGMSNSITRSSWGAMKTRCTNPNSLMWHIYGGAGIMYCDGFSSFKNFLEIMGKRPSRQFTLDRIKGELGYNCGQCSECKSRGLKLNCRWATHQVQADNKKASIKLKFDGKTLPLSQWEIITGISRRTIGSRIRNGWSAELALTVQIGEHRRKK
jgi:hypothetical protein